MAAAATTVFIFSSDGGSSNDSDLEDMPPTSDHEDDKDGTKSDHEDDKDGTKSDDEKPCGWDVEKVLGHRTVINNETNVAETEYKIKWEGYKQPTWEPHRLQAHMDVVMEYIKNNIETKQQERQEKKRTKKAQKTKVDNSAAPVAAPVTPTSSYEESFLNGLPRAGQRRSRTK